MSDAWHLFGVRLWHQADRAALDDDVWQGMKVAIQHRRMGRRDA